MGALIKWKYFWSFWLGGLVIFLGLILSNGAIVTAEAPQGILNHQRAGTGTAIDVIQQSWIAAGKYQAALWGMIGDLIFIGLYMSGGIIGGRLIWQQALSPALKKLGLVCVVIYFLFGLFDYVETISQIVQLLNQQGSDRLAGIAALCGPPKVLAFIAGTTTTFATLIWRSNERRA